MPDEVKAGAEATESAKINMERAEGKFVFDQDTMLRIECQKMVKDPKKKLAYGQNPAEIYIPCTGVLEAYPLDLATTMPPVIKCPKCGVEFSQGMRMSGGDDKVIAMARVFAGLCTGKYSSIYKVSLLKRPRPTEESS